jgi:hypothetical protein
MQGTDRVSSWCYRGKAMGGAEGSRSASEVIFLVEEAPEGITDGARLLELAGLDNQTIAEVLKTSPGTVRSVTASLRSKKGDR